MTYSINHAYMFRDHRHARIEQDRHHDEPIREDVMRHVAQRLNAGYYDDDRIADRLTDEQLDALAADVAAAAR